MLLAGNHKREGLKTADGMAMQLSQIWGSKLGWSKKAKNKASCEEGQLGC